MYYNICYDIVSLIILGLLIISKFNMFHAEEQISRQFMHVVAIAFVSCLIDIVAALCYASIIPISDIWMLMVETAYLLFAMYTCYLQLRVVCLRTAFKSEAFRNINFLIVAIMTICLLINIANKFMFEYIDHTFVGYHSFDSIYIVDGIMFVEMATVLVNRRRTLRKKVLFFSSAFFFFPIICILIQFADDRLLLSGAGVTAALLIFSFTLGDQNYESLQQAQTELEESKEIEKHYKADVEAANRVKTLFMERVSNEFKEPIEEAIAISTEMKIKSDDAKVKELIGEIEVANKQLLLFVDELLEASKALNK